MGAAAFVVTFEQVARPIRWPPVFVHQGSCKKGYAMVVDPVRRLVLVSADADKTVYVYSLADGALVRTIGSFGSDKGQFNWGYGGVCVTPRGTLLVAERNNKRLQEVTIDDGSHIRFIGEGSLDGPEYVDASASVIAVTEHPPHRVTLLSWEDGSVIAQFGSQGSDPGQLREPRGVRLLADGSGVIVADMSNNRLCVFTMTGVLVRSYAVPCNPRDVIECEGGASFVVTKWEGNALAKVSADSGDVVNFGRTGTVAGEFNYPAGLAVIADRGGDADSVELVVLEYGNPRLQVFRV